MVCSGRKAWDGHTGDRDAALHHRIMERSGGGLQMSVSGAFGLNKKR